MRIRLESVYANSARNELLYDLLMERRKDESISHRGPPTWEEHVRFVYLRPYMAWYFIYDEDNKVVGACYLSYRREIGVWVFKSYQAFGYAAEAVEEVMKINGPGQYLANINPENESHREMFQDIGFRKLQETYELWVNQRGQ